MNKSIQKLSLLLLALLLIIGVVPASVSAAVDPSVNYQTHVENVGWQMKVADGEVSGTSGQSLRLEGIHIDIDSNDYDLGVTYQTHIQNIGWEANTESGWKSDGQMSGTTGLSYRLEAIQLKLTRADASKFDIYYQVHAQNIGWMGWAKNGESAGTAGFSYRLEGIRIKIVPKGSQAPGSTEEPFRKEPGSIINVTAVELNKSTNMLTVGTTTILEPRVLPEDADNKTIKWTSSDPDIATVNSSGEVTALSAGIATITATTVDGNKSANCVVTVDKAPVNVTGISLNKATVTLNIGESDTLIPTVLPIDADDKTVKWTSSDPDIATVNSSGEVTALSAGIATITTTTVDGGKNANCVVTVNKPLITKIDDLTVNVMQYDLYELPSTVLAHFNTGTALEVDVAWKPAHADTSIIGTYTFEGSIVGYDGTVNLTLNVEKYKPNLQIYNYSSVTINNVCKQLSLNINNNGSKPISINKIEVYEKGNLVSTYSKSQLIDNNIATTVTPIENWGMSINYKIGIWIDNSYVKYYLESEGAPYEYTVNIE